MAIKRFIVLLWVISVQGCTQGLLYTHTTEPFTNDFRSTQNNSNAKNGEGSTKHIDIQLQAKWDSNGIGEIAKKNGIDEVDYADIETISVLFGIWEQQYVHVYGK